MVSMPQWELPHTKVEQAQRIVSVLHKDSLLSIKNRELIFSDILFGYFEEPCIIAVPYQGTLNVHVEQNVECTSHFLIPLKFWAAKLLSFGLSIAMQNVAVCGIRNWR